MKRTIGIKLQFATAIGMFVISIFMSVSYYIYISNHNATTIKIVALYFWIFLIFLWLIKVINDAKKLYK